VIGVFSRGRRGGDGRVGLLGLAGEGRYRDMGFVVHCGYAQVRYAVLVEDEVLGVKSSDFGEGVNGWLEGVRDVMKSITIEITSLYWRFLFFFFFFLPCATLLYQCSLYSTQYRYSTVIHSLSFPFIPSNKKTPHAPLKPCCLHGTFIMIHTGCGMTNFTFSTHTHIHRSIPPTDPSNIYIYFLAILPYLPNLPFSLYPVTQPRLK